MRQTNKQTTDGCKGGRKGTGEKGRKGEMRGGAEREMEGKKRRKGRSSHCYAGYPRQKSLRLLKWVYLAAECRS